MCGSIKHNKRLRVVFELPDYTYAAIHVECNPQTRAERDCSAAG
jgi:hypothetical protein